MLRALILTCAAIAFSGFALGQTAATPSPDAPMVILKLDDVIHWVSPQWRRVADYLEKEQIKSSFGIICQSLEKVQPETVTWIKDHRDRGLVEFWLHGYKTRTSADTTGEFETGTAQEQQAVLEKAQQLAKEKLGFEFTAFGPHWSGTTDATDEALEAIPSIKIWLYGPAKPKHFSRLSIPRVMGLENPTFVPDFEKFKTTYEKVGHSRKVLVLQGHPNQWTPERWEGFVKIVQYLKAQGCRFVTPSEYLALSPAR
jgi:peptidoglycan/xylan/chitin deacetylase (PgdA/CDA1 family)